MTETTPMNRALMEAAATKRSTVIQLTGFPHDVTLYGMLVQDYQDIMRSIETQLSREDYTALVQAAKQGKVEEDRMFIALIQNAMPVVLKATANWLGDGWSEEQVAQLQPSWLVQIVKAGFAFDYEQVQEIQNFVVSLFQQNSVSLSVSETPKPNEQVDKPGKVLTLNNASDLISPS